MRTMPLWITIIVAVTATALLTGAAKDFNKNPQNDGQKKETTQPADETKGGLVLNITSGVDDLHAVTMALQLAGHALADGRTAVLFLNVRAPELARKDFSPTLAFRDNPPIKTMLADLVERGAKVLVCPHCMKVQGLTEADLIPSAAVATRESLFGSLGPNTHVFSY